MIKWNSSLAGQTLQVLLLLFTLSSTAKADCYAHNGILALDTQFYSGPELVSCGKGTNNCCLANEKCGSNLLCGSPDGAVARQYCAVKSWNGCSALCPEYNAAGISLSSCGNNIYCCPNGDAQCCENGTGFFIDPETGEVKTASEASNNASPTWWSVDSAALLATTSSQVASSSTQSSSVVTSSEPTSSLASPSPSATSTSTSPVTTSSSPSPTQQSTSSHGLSAGAGAGIGIGCAAAVAAIAVLLWLFVRERRKRRALQLQTQGQAPATSVSQVPQYHDGGSYTEPDYRQYMQELPEQQVGTRQELEESTTGKRQT